MQRTKLIDETQELLLELLEEMTTGLFVILNIKKQQQTQARTYFALLISLLYSYTIPLYQLHSINLNEHKLVEFFTGTDVETRAFMAICVETLNRRVNRILNYVGVAYNMWWPMNSDGQWWPVMAHAFANYIV